MDAGDEAVELGAGVGLALLRGWGVVRKEEEVETDAAPAREAQQQLKANHANHGDLGAARLQFTPCHPPLAR